jgi:CheY-like chemotaxis protein/HPt (histidine-containing phosphotransfer) domain-containing protein
LINLINNAIKFTEKGHVYVSVSIREIKKEPYIRFDIEDTGIGVPPDKQQLIFEKFVQADGGTTRKFGGTGLGLPITKQLAHLLGGELTLTSEADKDTVFSLTIPAGVDVKSQPLLSEHDFMSESSRQIGAAEQDKFSGRILVAEDSKTNQMLINLLLGKFGLQATTVGDGKQAVDKALSQQFDLIFMDMQMPNMNGYEATKQLRSKGITTPIVALTAHAMKGDDKKCFSAGCDDYLAKPIKHETLLETIRKYLSSESRASSQRADSASSGADEPGRLCSDKTPSQAKSSESVNVQSAEEVIEWAAVTNICDDEIVIKEIAKAFLEDCPQTVSSIAEAIESENPADVQLYAHKLKGAALTIGAKRLSETAYRLECAGQKKDTAEAASLFDDVQSEFEKLTAFLSEADWIETAKQQENNKQTQTLQMNRK